MQICAEESGAADTVDPLGGSYYVEALTSAMETQILEEMARVERMGGIVEAVKSGALQARSRARRTASSRKLASGEIPKVGANCYVGDTPAAADREVELYASDPQVAAAQIARLERIRRDRDGAPWRARSRASVTKRGPRAISWTRSWRP